MSKLVVISFYTEGPHVPKYEAYAKRLRACCDKFGLEHDIRHMPQQKGTSPWDWTNNVRQKPAFIRKMLDERRDAETLVWIDADAVIHSKPHLLFKIKCDLAVSYLWWENHKKFELLSGTMLFRNTPKVRKAVDTWIEKMPTVAMTHPKPEQHCLEGIIKDLRLRVYKLPGEYCYICNFRKGKGDPIIEHHQASRIWRRSKNGRPHPRKGHPRAPQTVAKRRRRKRAVSQYGDDERIVGVTEYGEPIRRKRPHERRRRRGQR